MSKPQTIESIKELVAACRYYNWRFDVSMDGDRPVLQVKFNGVCMKSGKMEEQHGRKWLLSFHMTDSEIVQTAFKAVLTAVEHEVREFFTWHGEPIFRPHFDIHDLFRLSMKNAVDAREAV